MVGRKRRSTRVFVLNICLGRASALLRHLPIKRWLEKRGQWDAQYRRDLLHSRKIKLKDRRKAAQAGYLSRDLVGEDPPLSALLC